MCADVILAYLFVRLVDTLKLEKFLASEGFISESSVSVEYCGEYDSERVKGCRVRQPQRRGSKEGRTTVREVIGACGEGCVSWKRACVMRCRKSA